MRRIGASWLQSARRRLEDAWHTARYYAGGVYERSGEDQLFLKSGGIAYAFVLCFVPLALVLFAILGIILEKSSIRDALYAYVDKIIPYSGFAAQAKEFISRRVDEFRVHRTVAGVAGIVGLLLASSGLFGAIRTTLNAVYRLPASLSIVKGKLRDVRLVLQALLLFLVSIIVLPLVDIGLRYVVQLPEAVGLEFGLLERLFVNTGSFLLVALVYGLVYYSVPRKKPPRRAILVSALSAAVLLEIAKIAFGIYVDRAVLIQKIYGAYLFVAAIALWVYYSSLVFVLSAQIGRLAWERQEADS